MLATAVFAGTAGLSMAGSPRPGYALRPDRSIGPVSLGERKSRVERALGHRTSACPARRGSPCLRRYRSPRGNLIVQYFVSRVTRVGPPSGQITLGGVPLRRGPRHLHKQLRGWKHFACQGLQIYEHGEQPSTTIYFGYGQVEANVHAGPGRLRRTMMPAATRSSGQRSVCSPKC